MNMDKMNSIKFLFLCLHLFNFAYGQELFGWQSSWDDSDHFGAAFLYDKEMKSLYITGTESVSGSRSKCFLTSVRRNTGKNDYTQYYSSSGLTSCSSITQWKAKNVVTSGFSEEEINDQDFNSDNSNIQVVGTSDSQVKGFFFSGPQETGLANHIRYLTNYAVQYPQVIEEDELNDAIVIASYVTNDKTLSLDYMSFEKELDPVLQPTFGTFKYGKYFAFTLQQFKVASDGDMSRIGWSRLIKTVDDEDCRVHDLVVYKSRILFVGATAGSGAELGGSDSGAQLDGFVTQLESATGNNWPTNPTKRIKSQEGKHDIVNAICVDEANESIYLAGSSTGYFGGGTLDSEHASEQEKYQRFSAFIMKLDINSLDVMWSRMIHTYPSGRSDTSSPQDVIGLGCVVSSDRVFLSGMVKDNGHINDVKSNGKDDIFAACWNKSGVRQWRRQVGTDQDDTLSRGHRSIALDENNNVMVVGSTRGVMYSTKKNPLQSDAFIVTFSKKNGSNSMTTNAAGNAASGTDKASLSFIIIAGIAVLVIGFLVLLMMVNKRRNQKRFMANAAADADLSLSTEPSSTQAKQLENVEDLDYDEDKVKEII